MHFLRKKHLQSKKESFLETFLSVGTGFFIALLLNLFLLPLFIDDITNQVFSTAVIIGIIYTTVSMVRSYVFRRAFERVSEKYKRGIFNKQSWK